MDRELEMEMEKTGKKRKLWCTLFLTAVSIILFRRIRARRREKREASE